MSDMLRPIIGVLITRSTIIKLTRTKKGFRHRRYPKIFQLAKARQEAQVTLYFFSSININLIKETIIGTYYNEEDQLFKQKEFPLPDVVYCRGGSSASKSFLKLLKLKPVIKINPLTFNKWKVYKKLQKFPEVQVYLPFTKLYQGDQDIIDFLETHSELYLKGVRGGRGKRIFYLRKLAQGGYEYSYYVRKLIIQQVDNINQLLQRIREFYKSKSFIIQTPINLINLDGCRVDFRAELQRDGKGELTVSGIMARVGKPGAPITIHSAAYPIEVFFKLMLNYSDDKIHELTEQIHQFLFAVYESIEKSYGTFCEIGLDFGIDTSGKIWFIESNSTSAKVSLMKAYDEAIFHQAFLKPLQFARYLYFTSNNPSTDINTSCNDKSIEKLKAKTNLLSNKSKRRIYLLKP